MDRLKSFQISDMLSDAIADAFHNGYRNEADMAIHIKRYLESRRVRLVEMTEQQRQAIRDKRHKVLRKCGIYSPNEYEDVR